MTELFERYTDRAKNVLKMAQSEARDASSGPLAEIGPEHLLLGLLHDKETVAFKALNHFGIDLASVRVAVNGLHRPDDPSVTRPYSNAGLRVLKAAAAESAAMGDPFIGPEHLLLGLLTAQSQEMDPVLPRIIRALGNQPDIDLRQQVFGKLIRLDPRQPLDHVWSAPAAIPATPTWRSFNLSRGKTAEQGATAWFAAHPQVEYLGFTTLLDGRGALIITVCFRGEVDD